MTESQVLLLQVLLLLFGFVQLRRHTSSLVELLLECALYDGNILLDAADIWRTEATS